MGTLGMGCGAGRGHQEHRIGTGGLHLVGQRVAHGGSNPEACG